MNNKKKYPCPCCGFHTLDDRAGTFDICPVCYWEDDIIQYEKPDYDGGANEISLNTARENFKKFGAISTMYLKYVRAPLDEEK